MSKHTPGPWEVLRSRATKAATVIGTHHPDYLDSDGDGADLAYTCENGGNIPIVRENAEANAALIVRAVNAHDELVEALKVARNALYDHGTENFCAPAIECIEAALAKVSS